MVHDVEVASEEPPGVLCTGQREGQHLAAHRPNVHLDAWSHACPVDAGDRDVLTCGATTDRMAGAGQVVDDVGGPQAQCLPRAAVVLTMGLDVADNAAEADVQPVGRGLGHSTPGHVQLHDGAVRR